jgi:hypothetical protein
MDVNTGLAIKELVTIRGRPGTAARPPSGTTSLRTSGGWQLREAC